MTVVFKFSNYKNKDKELYLIFFNKIKDRINGLFNIEIY